MFNKSQIQETWSKLPARYMVTNLFKTSDKENISNIAREKIWTMYKKTKIRIKASFSAESKHNRRKWSDISKVLKEKNSK